MHRRRSKKNSRHPSRLMKVSEEVDEKEHSVSKRGTVFSGYTAMAKTMLGSGVLSISFACAKSGLIMGIVMLVFAAFLTWMSLHVISLLCLEFPSKDISFYSITERVIPRARWLLDVAVLIDCIGAAICFVQVIGTLLGDAVEQLFGLGTLSRRELVIIIQVIVVVALFPLCLIREISDTKIINIIGLSCLTYVGLLTVVYADLSNVDPDLMYPIDGIQALGALPTIIFAFSCQQNMLSVASEMKRPTIKKLDIVTVSAVLTGAMMYVPVMILPFLSYGRSKDAHTFFPLLPRSVAVQIGLIAAGLAIAISFVLDVHPIRRSVFSLMYGSDQPTGKKERSMRTIVVTAIVLVVLGVSIAAGESLGPTLEFTGLLGATTCGFVMPFILYLVHFGFAWKSATAVTVAGMLLLCLVLYPVGIAAIIMGIIHG